MKTSKLVEDIYIKYGVIDENKIKEILVSDYHMLNESTIDSLSEDLAGKLKDFGAKVSQVVGKVAKSLGGAIVTQVKKFNQLLLSFKSKNWMGYADPRTGTLIVGLYSKNGNGFAFATDPTESPVVFFNSKIGNKSIGEAFINKLSKELLLEVAGADFVGSPDDDKVKDAQAALGDYVRQADIESGENEPPSGFNDPTITVEEFISQIYPRFIRQVEARQDDDAPVPSFMLIGAPGIAKTYFINAAKAVGYNVATWELAGEQDFTVKGIPVVSRDQNGKKSVYYVPPQKLPQNPDENSEEDKGLDQQVKTTFAEAKKVKTVLFFDEFNRAPKEVFNVVMNFINKGVLDRYIIPTHTGIALACNAGDNVIDAEEVKSVAEAVFQRIKATYVMKYNARTDIRRTMAGAGREGYKVGNGDDWYDKKAGDKLRDALGFNDEVKSEAKDSDWVKDLGATLKFTGDDQELGFVSAFKSPIDGKNYGFKMGGQLAPIIENWKMYRSNGDIDNAAPYENSKWYKQSVEPLHQEHHTSSHGENFVYPIRKAILGSEGEEGRGDMTILGNSARELNKLSNLMKSNALYDFMNNFIYGASLSTKLNVTKPIKYYIDNWKKNGYDSAPEYYFIVNQEYYLQKSAPAIGQKSKEDEDVWVKDMLHFYHRERERGRILDREVALYAFSDFTENQIKNIVDMKNASDNSEGDDEKAKAANATIKKIQDVRVAFTNELSSLLNRFDTYKDFVKAAKSKIDELERNKKDFNQYINVDDFNEHINGDENEVYAYVAANIDKVIETLDIRNNGIINMVDSTKLKTTFAKEVMKALRVYSDKVGSSEASRIETSTLKHGPQTSDDFWNMVDSTIAGNKGAGSSDEGESEAPKKRGRPAGSKNKPKSESDEYDPISDGLHNLFEQMLK